MTTPSSFGSLAMAGVVVLTSTLIAASRLHADHGGQASVRPAPLSARPRGLEQTREPAPADSDDLFKKIYPVFAHPRCANCHGVVQDVEVEIEEGGKTKKVVTVTPDSHPAAADEDPKPEQSCDNCHNEPKAVFDAGWRLAPAFMRWAGRSEEELCAMQATEVRLRAARGGYLSHLADDPFIAQAWGGTAGGAHSEQPPLAKPPLDQKEFVKAAKAWVDAGAPCGSSGVISQVETLGANYGVDTPSGKTTVQVTGKRQVDITRFQDGTAVANVSGGGEETITNIVRGEGCTITTRASTVWRIDNGGGDPAAPKRVNVQVNTQIGEGWYEISAVIPGDKTITTQSQTTENTCGARNLNFPADTIELTWQPWEISIHCRSDFADGSMLCLAVEPQRAGAADGLIDRTVKGTENGGTWLSVSPASNARIDDGTGLPVNSVTTWHMLFSK